MFSLCEHYLVLFTGKENFPPPDFSYTLDSGICRLIPSNTVIGLLKFPLVAKVFSHRLQIQERLTKQVAHAIMNIP